MSESIDLTCPKCGAPLDFHKELSELSCPYCGYKEALVESDAVKIERLRTEASKETAQAMKQAAGSAVPKKKPLTLKEIKRRALIILAVSVALFSLLCLITSISDSHEYSNYIKERAEKTYTWPKSGLATLLPQPVSPHGELYLDAGKTLSAYVAQTSEEEYNQYVEDCKETGFDIGINQYSSYFEAYDEAGNYLDVSYDSDNLEMHLRLESAIETAPITWPENPLVQMLPVPPSLEGNIAEDYTDSCIIYIAGMSRSDFNHYATECNQAGFDQDSYKGESDFYGRDSEGNRLSLDYLPSKLLKIRVSAAR